jgi:hypothetical protein
VPLDLLDMSVPAQAGAIQHALATVKPAIRYYLNEYVFPRCLKYHRTKLQASGLDLGSDCLFSTRLGFSGTPSNLLAPSLVPCRFQTGTQSKVLGVLMNPSILKLARHAGPWAPRDLLRMVATGDYNALIDTGALITGYDNMEVAQYMCRHDSNDKFDAAIFLNRANQQVYITKSDPNQPKPLKLCGVPLTRRFTFYDQAHTTGTDIKQHPAAKALATVGKGVTYRDHCQAVWRMRGIERASR